jgi:hypothetical protein
MAKQKRTRGRATTADRHELYELSVQDPPSEVAFITRSYQKLRRRKPLTLREDFCGTAVFSLAWVKSDPKRTAVGVDLDRDTLHWGLEKRIRPAGEDVERRITLRNGNVLEPSGPQVEVAVGFNFSYWCFDTRESLRSYFEAARAGLLPGGVMYLDACGGTEIARPNVDEREVADETGVIDGEPFTYVWDQVSYNPLTGDMECAIHFEFEDGSRMDRAFTYTWRLWTLPELRELLLEAGFTKVRIWSEIEDDDGDGTGEYDEIEALDNEGSWWVYITAENGPPSRS